MSPVDSRGFHAPVPIDPFLFSESEGGSEAFAERHLSPAPSLDYPNSPLLRFDQLYPSSAASERQGQYEGGANGRPNYPIPSVGIDSQRTMAHDPRYTSANIINRNIAVDSIRYNSEQRDGHLQGNIGALESRRDPLNTPISPRCEYNLQFGGNPEMSTPMRQKSSYSPAQGASSPGSGQYSPFSGVFRSPEQARNYRRTATRCNRKPYRPPESDPTIQDISNNRETHVRRIYEAMINGDQAQDNPNSIAMRRWVQAAHYDSTMVSEALSNTMPNSY